MAPGQSRKPKTPQLTQSQSVLRAGRARVGVRVIGVLIGISAVGVTRGAGGGGAARVAWGNGEPRFDELGVRVKVDRGQVPIERAAVLGILELKDTVLVLGTRHLDRNAAAIGVGRPVLAVGAPAGGQGLHVARSGRGSPQVHGRAHVVDNLDAAATRARGRRGAGARGSGRAARCCAGVSGLVRHSGRSGGKESGNEGVGEHHLGYKRLVYGRD